MKYIPVVLAIGLLLAGCAKDIPEKVLPVLPAKTNPIKVTWKVIADVREIDGKKYLVMPFDGNPYVGLSYSDSLIFRSWLDDVKRKNDQTDNILCTLGYVEKCKSK